MATKEKDYAKIAKAKITRPSKSKRKPKILVYGRNKKGKTRLCTTVPGGKENCLIIDPEHGTDQMKAIDPPAWPVESWQDMQDAYGYLRSGKHPYEWLAVDGLTRLSNMALRYVMALSEEQSLERKPGLVQKRDYGKAGELVKQMLVNLHNLDMGVIYTAQERMVEGSSGDDDEDSEEIAAAYVPDLPKGARNAVLSIVDVIGRLYVVKVENKKGEMVNQRRLYVGINAQYDTGFRSDYALPDVIKRPTVEKVVNLIQTGSER